MYMKWDVLILLITFRGLCRGLWITSYLTALEQPAELLVVHGDSKVEEDSGGGMRLIRRRSSWVAPGASNAADINLVHPPLSYWGSCRFHHINPAHTSTMSVIRASFILISMLMYLLPSFPGRYGPESVIHRKA